MVAVAVTSAIASFVAWHKKAVLVVLPLVASVATVVVVLSAGFPFSPLVWGNVLSIALSVWWVAFGRLAEREA